MDQGRAQDFAPRLLAPVVQPGETVYRVTATAEGWVRVRGNQIAGSRIRVYHRGAEIPVWTVNPGSPTTADADVRFLARGYRGTATDHSVYAVIATTEPGLLMTAVPRPPAAGLATTAVHTALSVLDREIYYIPTYRPYDVTIDHWFSELFYSTQDRVVTFPTPNRVPSGNAKLWLRAGDKDAAAGNTPTRTVDARSGVTLLASLNYKEQGTNWVSATVSAASLGVNTTALTFRNRTSGANPILGYVHELALEYPADNRAVNDELAFVRPAAAENVVVSGFTSADIVALDTTDGSRPLRLTGLSVFPTNGSFAASFHRATNTTNAYLLTTHARRTDAVLTLVNTAAAAGLTARTNQADWVVIAPDPASPALRRLEAHRQAQGLSTRVIALQAVFDAFGYGHRDPAALRQAIGYMFHHWARPAPRHLLLVGDATFDPRDRQSSGRPDELPTRFGPGPYEWGAQDPWYARVSGNDTLPDVSLGRLPTANETLLGVMVDKIIAFESAAPNASWRARATLIADKLDVSAGNFKARSETLRAAHFGGMSVTTGYVDDESGATVRAKTFATYANGARVLQYMGHGLHDRWADTPAGLLFNNADSATLSNVVHPIVTVFACQNGQFQGGPFTANVEGLCEALLEQSKGAVATIGASAEALEIGSGVWADGLWSGMLTRRKYRLGDAQRDAWASTFALSPTFSELQFYHLFGDPALVVNPISSAAADSDSDGMTDGFERDRGLQPFVADGEGDLDGDGSQNLDEFQRGTRPDRPDTDGDGLADGIESALGTNPLLVDTDGDLLPDAWESQNGGNPLVPDASADSDGDGLALAEEYALGTHAQSADTDGDGMADKVEILAGRDPLDPFDLAPGTADSDGDGLLWATERLLGTNPGRADTDGDGRSDGAEVSAGTNPLVADTDGDGLSDGVEFTFGSDPLLADTDGDGVSDVREQQYGLNPLLADGNADPDGDGMVVLEELFLGTNPVVADTDGDSLNDGVEVRVRLTKPLKTDTDADGLTDGEEVLTHGSNPLVKDTDGDGLQDKTETTAGSNPLLTDTDGDTLPDLWEWSNGLNLLLNDAALDKDGDGLTNVQERQAGTTANRVDTDNDGLSDFAELNIHGSNPTRYDTEFDTAHDGQEPIRTWSTPTATACPMVTKFPKA
jgi:hypothetical protein